MMKPARAMVCGFVLAGLAARPVHGATEGPPGSTMGAPGGEKLDTPSGGSDWLVQALANEQKTTDAPRTTDLTRRAASAANPLERFMAAWLSPGDFRMLQQKSSATSPLAASGEALVRRPGQGGAVLAAGANPYLAEAFAAPAPMIAAAANQPAHPPKASAKPAAAAAMPTAIAPGAGTAAAPPQGGRPSDPFPGRDDAKYFKQLKRF